MGKIPNWSKVDTDMFRDDEEIDESLELLHVWQHDVSDEMVFFARNTIDSTTYQTLVDGDDLFEHETRNEGYYATTDWLKDNVHRLTGSMESPAHCPECGHLLGRNTDPTPESVAHCNGCDTSFGVEELVEEGLYSYGD